jgi:HPt (histidine-containing phosphotransfer) domain-containing protein
LPASPAGNGLPGPTDPAPPAEPAPGLDCAALLDRLGGDVALLREILSLFQGECPRLMRDLDQAVAQRDPERIRQGAHTLKGTLLNLSAAEAYAAALCLEKLGLARDLSAVDGAWAALQRQMDLLDLTISRFLKDPKP